MGKTLHYKPLEKRPKNTFTKRFIYLYLEINSKIRDLQPPMYRDREVCSKFEVHSHITSAFAFFFDLCGPILENEKVKCEYILEI